MPDEHDKLIDEEQPLLDEPERVPVVTGVAYLLLVIVCLCAVAGWLVLMYTRG